MALSMGMEVAMIQTEGALHSCVTPKWTAYDQKHVCSFRQCQRVWKHRKVGSWGILEPLKPQSPSTPQPSCSVSVPGLCHTTCSARLTDMDGRSAFSHNMVDELATEALVHQGSW